MKDKFLGAVRSGERGNYLTSAASGQHGDWSNKTSHAHGACVQRINSQASRSALDLQAHRPDASATGIPAAPRPLLLRVGPTRAQAGRHTFAEA